MTELAASARKLAKRAAAGVALVALVAVHLNLGPSGVRLDDVLAADPQAVAVLLGSRLPRTVAGLVTGVALGVAGALIQGATRNPLAAPDTVGINAGAYLGVVAVTVSGLHLGLAPQGAAAFAGGVAAAVVVWLLTGGTARAPGQVLLAGTAVALVATSLATLLIIFNEQVGQSLFFWGNGTLLQTGLARPLAMGIVVLVAGTAALLLSRPLDVLALGDDTADALGVPTGRIRLVALGLAIALAAAAVTASGPLAFAGLLAPILVRGLGVRRHAALLPLAGVAGAVVVLAADALAQLVVGRTAGYGELPAGVVTALLGGPAFVLVARRVSTGDADTGTAVTVGRPRFYPVALALAALAVLAAVVVGLRVGDVPVTWGGLLSALAGGGDAITQAVVGYRLPRLIVAGLAGACLAAAGLAVQAVIRNPLAEPWLLGVTGGASLGAVALIVLVPGAAAVSIPLAALLGGVGALALVVLLARQGGRLDPTRVVLVGIGVAAVTTALVHVLALRAQLSVATALTWMAGSTYARDLSTVWWLLPGVAVAVLLLLAARPVDLLGLGDDLPRAVGLRLGRARLLVLAGAALLAASAAAAVGIVGFVGLMAPHLARRLAGPGVRRALPLAMLLGAALVVASDAIGRAVLAPREIPVGIVTALAGAPYLVWLLRRREAPR